MKKRESRMSFPAQERVIFKQNPLIEVICQFRFPPILRITDSKPTNFQDRIRHLYPEFKATTSGSIIPPELMNQLPKGIVDLWSSNNAKTTYEFSSSNETWLVSLTTDFLALVSKNYVSWDDFLEHLEVPLTAFLDEYKPSYYTRIGLRYQNLIRRSDWDIKNVPWENLINPHMVGILADAEIGKDVTETISQTVVDFVDQPGKVKMRYGLVRRIEDGVTDEELSFLLDNDCFIDERTEIEHGYDILTEFNDRAGRVFNWSITDDFRQLMV